MYWHAMEEENVHLLPHSIRIRDVNAKVPSKAQHIPHNAQSTPPHSLHSLRSQVPSTSTSQAASCFSSLLSVLSALDVVQLSRDPFLGKFALRSLSGEGKQSKFVLCLCYFAD